MRSIYLLLILVLFISCKSASTKKSIADDATPKAIFSVNNEPVYADEFIYAYNKSSKNKGERENINEYLELYINFKLKVADAKKEGLDTLPSYKKELAGYLQDIKKPYLTSEKVNEALLEETYNRLQQEVKASHILIRLAPDASPADTLKAYNQILKVKSEFLNGVPFNELAEKYSEDPSAQQNQGSLGWFTAFQMVYPFETGAYQTEKGELSDIIRTRFGYHIIYTEDKRETSGKIKISHIMLRIPPNGSQEDSMKVRNKIYAIHNQLIEGENWFALAVKYSEDLSSKDAGGSLPWFGVGGLPKSLENSAFKLSQPGQISSPVKSAYGWHIIKLEEKRGMGSLESMRESLSRRIQRDQRSELKSSEVISKLKNENHFLKNEQVYTQLRAIDKLTIKEIPTNLLSQSLFSINKQDYGVASFIKQIKKNQSFDQAVELYEKEKLFAYEDAHLGEKYPQYQLLASEYRDGLLLFEIMSQKVWNKISSDTIGIRNYYEANKANFLSPLKIEADIFYLEDSSEIQSLNHPLYDSLYQISTLYDLNGDKSFTKIEDFIKPLINSFYVQITLPNNYNNESIIEVKSRLSASNENIKFLKPIYSEENKIYLQFYKRTDKYLKDYFKSILRLESGIFNADDLELNQKDIVIGQSFLTKDNGDIKLLNLINIIPQRNLSYDEAKSDLITDYQVYLEKNWIEQLKNENTVIVNQDVLKKIKDEFEK